VLYDAAAGKPLVTLRGPASPPDYPDFLEARDGYLRIRHTWGTIRVDAWLSEAQAKLAARIQGGMRARAPRVRMGRRVVMQLATVERPASVSVGARPGGSAVGSLKPRSVVRVLTEAVGELAVRVQEAGIEPPEGQSFWVAKSAVGEMRTAAGYE
jgi:hypothetical protein